MDRHPRIELGTQPSHGCVIIRFTNAGWRPFPESNRDSYFRRVECCPLHQRGIIMAIYIAKVQGAGFEPAMGLLTRSVISTVLSSTEVPLGFDNISMLSTTD